ncbi:phosphoenolpyruvate mutase [Skermanella aerolata]|uniref:phosphoenolpyruvate mutase n=1 Tax=Skermanella aerolata TaxID=393310 RepID=A0A512DWC6_9PROT|nr:phosphoenolpyruvate mutase [Skermanella aerolata]GEO40778.1 phosphoenolpyruvate mutase [Skermanella aerolata]
MRSNLNATENPIASTSATPSPPVLNRFQALRQLLLSPDLSFLMEAHNGLSAKIVEETGFQGIWASGLSISASLGVRDNNEASWTQFLEVLEFMADATSIPMLVDGDTGFGNFNNVRRLVRKLCDRGVAGVCIEDKLFPKTNSFIGDHQPLADMEEFCGRIRAGKDSQTNDDFSIVARVEALIAGQGMDEALRRAEAYHAAGADAILIHSKRSSAAEILSFMEHWGQRCPVVIVPTMYYATPTEAFREAGVSTVIWANHNIRAAISAMRDVTGRIHREQSLAGLERDLPTVKDIFRLTGQDELNEAEKRYLPVRTGAHAIILAASRGEPLGPLTESLPKCMIDIRGQPLLGRLVATLKERGIEEVDVVRGFAKETIAVQGIRTIDNDDYASTGELFSLNRARDRLSGPTVVIYGDILFRPHILDGLMETPGDIVVAADAFWQRRSSESINQRDLIAADTAYSGNFLDEEPVALRSIGAHDEGIEVCGEFIGMVRFSDEGARIARDEIDAMEAEGVLPTSDLPELLNRLARRTTVNVHYVTGYWLDVDTLRDLDDAHHFP